MNYLTPENIIKINSTLAPYSHLLDPCRVEAAAGSIKNDYLPTVEEKAAALIYYLTMGHPFQDGNKRTALISMLVFLRMNEIEIVYRKNIGVDLVLGIVNKTLDRENIIQWILNNKK